MKINKRNFGIVDDNLNVELFELENNSKMKVSITNYGGIITEIIVPDKEEVLSDVTLGYANIDGYLDKSPFFGAIIGRYGNRIKNGSFQLDGKIYNVTKNEDSNHLHGGLKGFDKVVWDTEIFRTESEIGLKLRYLSKDEEEGYPGNLYANVKYTLDNSNSLRIDYHAETDKKTLCNLTNHTYFNLKDAGASSILDHEIMIFADEYIPIDSKAIPFGKIESVHNTPFDFNTPKKITERINQKNEQLINGIGYDHTYVINGENGKLRKAASVYEESTGRVLEVFTTEPGMQFYSGNHLDGSITGKDGNKYKYRNGLCLETQHFPDSPNNPNFPTTVLNPGEIYNSTTIYKFSVR